MKGTECRKVGKVKRNIYKQHKRSWSDATHSAMRLPTLINPWWVCHTAWHRGAHCLWWSLPRADDAFASTKHVTIRLRQRGHHFRETLNLTTLKYLPLGNDPSQGSYLNGARDRYRNLTLLGQCAFCAHHSPVTQSSIETNTIISEKKT